MFTSSIERLAILQAIERGVGHELEPCRAQLLEQRAKRFSLDRRHVLEIGERKAGDGNPAASATTARTRSKASCRVDGVPTIRISPAVAGTDGAPPATGTSTTRTNVVCRPWRRWRTSSAIIPRWMMSWVAASEAMS